MPYRKGALGRAISGLRTERGLSQEVLSGLAGISRSHLAAIESGLKMPRADTLWRIADALEIRASDLVRRAEALDEQTTSKD